MTPSPLDSHACWNTSHMDFKAFSSSLATASPSSIFSKSTSPRAPVPPPMPPPPPLEPEPAPLPPESLLNTFSLSNGAKALLAAFPAFSADFPAASIPSARSSAPPAAADKSDANCPESPTGIDIPNSFDKIAPICFAMAIRAERTVFKNFTTGVNTIIRPEPRTDSNSLNCSDSILVWFAQLPEVFAKSPAARAVCCITYAYCSSTFSACVMACMLLLIPCCLANSSMFT